MRGLAGSAAALLALIATQQAVGAKPTSHVVGARSIGGLRVDPGTPFRRVLRYFGPLEATFSNGQCTLASMRAGLEFDFGSLDGNRGTPATCEFFERATVTDAVWHTTNGLRIGAPLRTLRRLFPTAYDYGLVKPPAGVRNWCALWSLHGASGHVAHTILIAYVTRGRVIALGVETVGH